MLIRFPRAAGLPPYPPAKDGDGGISVTACLLLELRKANRTIMRLRDVALAARDGDAKKLRAALVSLRPRDLDGRRPRSQRGA
jgi:hypothetical protein